MNFEQFVAGQKSRWKLAKKLGEGDAGEVFLVDSPLGGRQAILKRPVRSAFASDALRQAAQIRREAAILRALGRHSWPDQATGILIPALLDQSPPGDGTGERFFIVIERAPGYDLKTLSQVARHGLLDELGLTMQSAERNFLLGLHEHGQIPEPILVRALLATITMMGTVHFSPVESDGAEHSGIIWNDVKPEHLFWDPAQARLSIIDWGNSQFLESDGVTRDRLYSYKNDCQQFLVEMGAFIQESNPDLYERLEWPDRVPAHESYSHGIQPLKVKLVVLQEHLLDDLNRLRAEENTLYDADRPGLEELSAFETCQRNLADLGEVPDAARAANLHARAALQALSEQSFHDFRVVCQKTAGLSGELVEKWGLLDEIARVASQFSTQNSASAAAFSAALAAGVADDWPTLLWELFTNIGEKELPEWWEPVSRRVRQVYLKLAPDALLPYTYMTRLFFTLQSAQRSAAPAGEQEGLIQSMQEELIKKWREMEPSPPHAGIGYTEITSSLAAIEAALPGAQAGLDRAMSQLIHHAGQAVAAWDRKEFDQARRALHMILVWDPDRRRLLMADRAIEKAGEWLAKVTSGAAQDEPFYDYLTAVELSGRTLRNQVGPAVWLDAILEAFKRLRKGFRPADLMIDLPEILIGIPWLNEYRSREVLALPRSRSLTLERDIAAPEHTTVITGVIEGSLGVGQDIQLAESLDTWAPEARGSSARVFSGLLRPGHGKARPYALKIMRPDRSEYALPLFREEVQVLTMLQDVPGITPLVECGFIRLADGQELPAEESHASAGSSSGQCLRYGVEESQNFLASMPRYIADGWLPYLALVRRSHEHNLMVYCDSGRTHGWYLPLSESLLLSIQICDILQVAHDRNIVYRDHKILHYAWDPSVHGVVMIDWNIARRLPQGMSDAERQFDLVQYAARALHHILTGRPAPGALPLGPNRPEDIESASRSYAVQWTYDDERLPNRVKEILEQALTSGYAYFRELRSDLAQVHQQLAASEK